MDDKAAAWTATSHGTGKSGKEVRKRERETGRETEGGGQLLFHYIPLIQPSSQHITDKAHTDSSPHCVSVYINVCLCILTESDSDTEDKMCYVSKREFVYECETT